MKIDISVYEQINIYNNNGVIFTTERGGLHRATIDSKKNKILPGDVIYNIELSTNSIRAARSISFLKNDVFTIKYSASRYSFKNGKALYIPASYIDVESLEKFFNITIKKGIK